MTAGISSRPIAGPNVSLSRGALAGLLGATLLAGGLLGATVAFESASVGASRTVSGVSASDASAVSQALIQVRAGERASMAGTIAGPVATGVVPSERDSLRLEHVATRIGPAVTGRLNERRR
jgi:hypothetical protein